MHLQFRPTFEWRCCCQRPLLLIEAKWLLQHRCIFCCIIHHGITNAMIVKCNVDHLLLTYSCCADDCRMTILVKWNGNIHEYEVIEWVILTYNCIILSIECQRHSNVADSCRTGSIVWTFKQSQAAVVHGLVCCSEIEWKCVKNTIDDRLNWMFGV